MKTTLINLLAAAFAVGIATSVSAAPPGKGPLGDEIAKYSQQATSQVEIQNPKKSDRVAVRCAACKSATCCQNGGTTQADACQKKVTVQHVGPPGKGFDTSKVKCVNAGGKEC